MLEQAQRVNIIHIAEQLTARLYPNDLLLHQFAKVGHFGMLAIQLAKYPNHDQRQFFIKLLGSNEVGEILASLPGFLPSKPISQDQLAGLVRQHLQALPYPLIPLEVVRCNNYSDYFQKLDRALTQVKANSSWQEKLARIQDQVVQTANQSGRLSQLSQARWLAQQKVDNFGSPTGFDIMAVSWEVAGEGSNPFTPLISIREFGYEPIGLTKNIWGKEIFMIVAHPKT